MRRAAVEVTRRALRSGSSRIDRTMIARGLDVAGQVGSAASAMVRTRRDPALIALRRRQAARRRLAIWGTGAALGTAGVASQVVSIVNSGVGPMAVFYLLVCLGLLLWAGGGAVRAGRDLRLRSRTVAALPPPQPARASVAPELRTRIDRLNRMSDSLRELVAMIGIVENGHVAELRRDVVGAADAAEQRLRRLAGEVTAMVRSRRSAAPDARPAITVSVERLTVELDEGVGEYGRLVGAAGDAVAASRGLSTRVFELPEMTDRLQALAGGMRELSQG